MSEQVADKNMLDEKRKKQLVKFTENIEIKFKNFDLLNIALTHGSYLKDYKNVQTKDNERLEFFGDAVLKLFISEYLMAKYPDHSEGELSNIRAFVVSEKVLTKVAEKLGIEKFLLVAKNIRHNIPQSVKANSIEALIAAIYYECGPSKAKEFILSKWLEYIHFAVKDREKENYKAVLQEYTQGRKLGLPIYKTVREQGPDHNKLFEVAVYMQGTEIAKGKGGNKKSAEQDAAKNALKFFFKDKK